jgi:alpha-galactosidase
MAAVTGAALLATMLLSACEGGALIAIERTNSDSGGRVEPIPREASLIDVRRDVAGAPVDAMVADECGATVPDVPAALPPMGWSGWRKYQCSPELDEAKFVDMLGALASSGMQAAGYRMATLNDCWQAARAGDGTLVTDAHFPSGIALLARLAHARGLQVGLGSSRSAVSCGTGAGSLDHESLDARTFADWGADMLTYNDCSASSVDRRKPYQTMAAALKMQGRPIIFALGTPVFEEWMPSIGQLSRTAQLLTPTWTSILAAVDATEPLAPYAHYGAWNDPDALQVGNGTLTESESRAQFTLWSMWSAPLFAGNDLTAMSETTRAILTNAEIIAIDQDRLGLQAAKVRDSGDVQIFAKPLASCGARAVAVFNRGLLRVPVTVEREDAGLAPGAATVDDLWNPATTVVLASDLHLKTVMVEPHGVVALKIVGTEHPLPRGDVFLSDLPLSYVVNYWGPVERDTSNGENAARDGTTMKLRGKSYVKGLGVHAPSALRYRLGGGCTRFTAEVGVDDEIAPRGSVVFQVWADGKLLRETPVLTPASPIIPLDIDVTGYRELRLVVTKGGDDESADHGDWAAALLHCRP